jgi:hypothetical protein
MGEEFFDDPVYIKKVIDYSLHQAKAGIRVPGVWKGEAEPLNRYYPATYDADKKQYTVPEKNVTLEEWLRLTIHTDKTVSDFKYWGRDRAEAVRAWAKEHGLAVVEGKGKGKGRGGHGKGQSATASWGPVAPELAALLNPALKTPAWTEWEVAKTEYAFKLRRSQCDRGGSKHCLAVIMTGGQHEHTKGPASRCEVYLLPDIHQVNVRCHGGPMGSRRMWTRVEDGSAFEAIWPHIERREEAQPAQEGEEEPRPMREGGEEQPDNERVLPPKSQDTTKGSPVTLGR